MIRNVRAAFCVSVGSRLGEGLNQLVKLSKDSFCVFDRLFLNMGDGQLICVDPHILKRALEHSHVRDLLDQVAQDLVHLSLGAIFVIKRCQVVLVLHVKVANSHRHVLFLLLLKGAVQMALPLISRFLFKNSCELLLGVVNRVKRCALVHSGLADAAIPG